MKPTLDFRDDLIDKEVVEKLSKEVSSYIIEQVKHNMDKSIEERAKEYANRHKATEFAYFGPNRRYSYERVYNADIVSYERGAKEQKAIDIQKACEWLKNNWREYVNQDRDGMILFGHWESNFRKAMEK